MDCWLFAPLCQTPSPKKASIYRLLEPKSDFTRENPISPSPPKNPHGPDSPTSRIVLLGFDSVSASQSTPLSPCHKAPGIRPFLPPVAGVEKRPFCPLGWYDSGQIASKNIPGYQQNHTKTTCSKKKLPNPSILPQTNSPEFFPNFTSSAFALCCASSASLMACSAAC